MTYVDVAPLFHNGSQEVDYLLPLFWQHFPLKPPGHWQCCCPLSVTMIPPLLQARGGQAEIEKSDLGFRFELPSFFSVFYVQTTQKFAIF